MAGIDTWWPVHHAYKGVTLIVDFKWRNGIDVPSSVVINCTGRPGQHSTLGSIEKDQNWGTLQEATDYGVRQAEIWCDSLREKGLI
ncbi:hypothetical protein AC788_04040 [Pseudomonas sp. RIT-PI-a]|nr:hypothetical protein AC788_04040 [Pseudomonas sp. RIT-PI-a]